MRIFSVVVAALVGWFGWMGAARAAEEAKEPVYGFAQVGIGLLEIGHVEAGAFIGPHLTVEAMAAQNGVFGGHYGGGVMALIGHAQGPRPPRHALLVGARLMLNSDATFDSHGDDLTSYGVLPVGYGFLADNGFYFRGTAGLVLDRERADAGHRLAVGGPFVTASVGLAF